MTRLYLALPYGVTARESVRMQRLTDAGYDVVHCQPEPADALQWGPWARYALVLMLSTDGIALVRERTRGTNLLCRTAHELAMPIRTVPGWLTKAGQDAHMQRLRGTTHE